MLKKQFLRSLVLVSMLALSIVGPLSSMVFAEGQTFDAKKFPIANMYYEIAPEYDQPAEWSKDEPSMILFQKGTIANMSGSEYAGPIEVQVPASEKDFQVLSVVEYNADAKTNADGTPVEYKLDAAKGVVTFTPSKPIAKNGTYTFGVSIICNPFKVDGAKKSFEVTYKAPADIQGFDVAVYAPINAKNAKVDPKPDKEEVKSKETLFTYHINDLKAGAEKTFKVQYEKKDNLTTNQWVQKNGEPKEKTSTSETPKSALDTKVALIISGAILIFGIILFFAIRGKKANQNVSRQQRRNEARKHQTESKSYQSASVKKKVLRKLLIDGEITEEEFAEEMKNL